MEQPLVKTLQGTVQGFQRQAINGDEFYAFLGIPYAKLPIGDLRFKEPVPADPWVGIKDCTKDGDASFQREFLQQKDFIGSENCLHLNVYTRTLPKEGPKELKPVMLFIHGGAFKVGYNSPTLYGPDFLLTENIVLVIINYRLGLLGKLCTENRLSFAKNRV